MTSKSSGSEREVAVTLEATTASVEQAMGLMEVAGDEVVVAAVIIVVAEPSSSQRRNDGHQGQPLRTRGWP